MTSESQAAEGVHASAAPELPLLQGITKTAALSSAEGSSLGLPAGFTATPEVQPLRSEAKSGYTSTSTQAPNIPDFDGAQKAQAWVAARPAIDAAASRADVDDSVLLDDESDDDS